MIATPTTIAWTFFFFFFCLVWLWISFTTTLLSFNYLNYAEFWPFEHGFDFLRKSFAIMSSEWDDFSKLRNTFFSNDIFLLLLKFLLWQRQECRSWSNLLFANDPQSLVSAAHVHMAVGHLLGPRQPSAVHSSSARVSLYYYSRGSSCLCLVNC